MVVIEGFDRTDSCQYLRNMSDELWKEHTTQITALFEKLQEEEGDRCPTFKEFCESFRKCEKMTKAMLKQKASEEKNSE